MSSTFKIIAIGAVAIGALIAVAVSLGLGNLAFRYFMAEPTGIVEAEETIQGGSNRIAAYNKFFDLCASAQAKEAQIDGQMAILDTMSDDDKSRVMTNIAALEGARLRDIRTYNSDARKSYTAGQFRSSDLPYQLPTNRYEGVNGLNCSN